MVLKKYTTDEYYTKWSEWLEQEQYLELKHKEKKFNIIYETFKIL